MASSHQDDDLSPSEFLKSIQNLGAKKDAEDAERVAALEKEIEQGRREREMRRAERARSISPEKPAQRASRDSTPASPRASETTSNAKMADETSTTSPTTSTPQTASQLARSGTLSWQQRPKSRGGDGRRPLSWLAQENAARSPRDTPERARSPLKTSPDASGSSTPDPSSENDKEPSRAQIAEALGSKDPTWFRQTPDRGIGSAAYRRSQEEDNTSSSAGRMRLPGMSRESTAEAEVTGSPPPDSTRSSSPSRTNSVRDSTFSNNRYSSTTAGTEFGSLRMKSPPASILDAPKLEPSPSERKTPLGARPPSPTKGMGGFVESAMLKRADSVSKRWSQQSGAGLTRTGSSASNRNGYGGAMPVTDLASSASRDNSLEPSSRPTSSHSNLTVTQRSENASTAKDADGFVKPSLPDRSHSRSKSVASLRSLSNEQGNEPGSPASPSKRWSPTKSSWLESSLLKEEKPKVVAQPPPAQPSWMVEINKAKQQRAASPAKELSSPVSTEPKVLPFGREILKPTSKESSRPSSVTEAKPAPMPTSKPLSPTEPKAKPPSPEVAAKPAALAKDKPDTSAKPSSPSPPPSLVKTRTNSFEPAKTAMPSSPGKFDFRANLKSRAPPPDAGKSEEPEFKNLLGNLKRTKTQNWVPPDTLKDNITRGKAALNVTGGVPERKRVDELKEQLNAQKAAIKARAEAGDAPPRPQKPAELPSTPEALARRKTLNKSESAKDAMPSGLNRSSREETPEALAAMRAVRGQAKPSVTNAKLESPAVKEKSPPPVAEKRISNLTIGSGPSTSEKAKPEPAVEKAVETSVEKPVDKYAENPVEPSAPKSTAQPFGLAGMVKPGVSSKLADRFNPALASMLARGPPGSGSASKGASPSDSPALSRTTTQDEQPGTGPELEHKTKGRARGPKRRAKGKAAHTAEEETKVEEAKEEVKATTAKPQPIDVESKPATSTVGSMPADRTPPMHTRLPSVQPVKPSQVLHSSPASSTLSMAAEAKPEAPDTPARKTKPLTPSKSSRLSSAEVKPDVDSETSKRTSTPNRLPLREQQGNIVSPKPAESPSPTKTRPLPTPPADSKTETPKKETTSKAAIGALFEQRFHNTPPSRSSNNSPAPASEDSMAPMSVRDSTALFARQESPGPFSSGRRSPIKLPTKQDEEKAMRDAGLMPPPQAPVDPQKPTKEAATHGQKSGTTGLGISSVATASSAVVEISRSGKKSPLSPPLSVRPSPINGNAGPKTPAESPKPGAPAESPIPHTSEATRLFGDFFDERPVATRPENIDTLSILESSPLSTEKVTTIKKQLQEITNDGKLTSVASHQEHILFDQSMYVCTHVFSTSKGVKSTEVYLWAGSDVSPAALEDAQLFGKRVAKDNSGKFILIQQGQETPNFIQALGGILITFKGSKSRSSIGVPLQFVLCGRRHLGHVVFDEVDFSLQSFCSGFPYLISANNKLYLWKGIGCHQEELSSARLITMDVSPMPDLTEIEEGKEPASFFSLFPPLPKYPKNTMPRSADHWRLRPRHDNYGVRLFRVEQTRQKSMSLQPRTPLSATPTGTLTTKIVEIAPFGQADLRADSVFVLDAFFEVYVIIGPLAQSQSHAFAAALHFAQDYGILAASTQDRPFVPVSTVVMEGSPRDMRFCFRNWDNERGVGGTESLMAGLRRAGSLRCVGLSAALASLRVNS
ncbi:uncharacterized protein PV09_04140 [Verruconis gallopava]|uniref:Uncharacterized protein n=1 Tax=Verruconis gallopava TaxID=253628 RepID=A0A0D2ADF3_9PEZI|nr:uncharacterized protein PV09_04140 [Verruconis gallopava]KIW04978.1 hypothetical protein PV09_04140 [Verruconis gallopava]